jgi:hypothetical protein
MMQLQKATREQVKLRMGVSAVAGGGKTMSALLLAKGLVGDWSKIAVIDTENKSASLYAHLGPYNTIALDAPYSPERYIEAIKACEDGGMEAVIIDSITHEWDGKGGCLDIMDKLGGKYQDWAKVTPRHQAFIDAILQSKCHVITSVRRKQDYEMTKVDGKVKVEKAGLKEVTREGFEYELTLNFNIDERHNATASKDRTGLFMDKPAFVISEETGVAIKHWCETGVDAEAERKAQEKAAADAKTTAVKAATKALKACKTLGELQTAYTLIDNAIKPDVVSIKDEMKVKLTPATATTPAK